MLHVYPREAWWGTCARAWVCKWHARTCPYGPVVHLHVYHALSPTCTCGFTWRRRLCEHQKVFFTNRPYFHFLRCYEPAVKLFHHEMFHPQRKYVPQGRVFTGKSPLGKPSVLEHVMAPWVSLLRLKLTSWREISPASVPQWPYWSIFQVTGFRLLEKLGPEICHELCLYLSSSGLYSYQL